MVADNNPIQQKYWSKIWAYPVNEAEPNLNLEDSYRKDEKDENYVFDRLKHTNRIVLLKVGIVTFLIFLFCVLLPFWYWNWIGFGVLYLSVFWILFLSPYSNMRKNMKISIKSYVHDVIYEDPKSPGVFLKKHIKEQKYEYGAFLFFWMLGVCIYIYANAPVFDQIIPYQSDFINKLPNIVPVSIIMALFVTIFFGIVLGNTMPRSKRGRLRKRMFFAAIGVSLVLIVIVAFINLSSIQDFIQNFDKYSIRYPRNLTKSIPWFGSYHINYNLFFWTLGMILSGFGAMFFALIFSLYQNHIIRRTIDNIYHSILERDEEHNWNYKPVKDRIDSDKKKMHKIKRVAAIELSIYFSIVLFTLWGVYYWLRLRTLAEILIALLLIWAFAISPLIHYRFEKNVIYRKPNQNMGYVLLDDRGVGSWRLFWRKHKNEKVVRRILLVISGLTILGLAGMAFQGQSVIFGIFNTVGVPDYATLGAFSIIYAIVSIAVFVFSVHVLKFDDIKDPERGWKRIYSLIFLVVVGMLVFLGIPGVLKTEGSEITQFYGSMTASTGGFLHGLWAFAAVIILIGIILFIFNVIWFPLFIRFEDLYSSIKNLLFIMVVGIVILTTWNYLAAIFLDIGSGLTNPSWTTANPTTLRQNFNLGFYAVDVFGYQYWGWVQELLFLGYFCWLSWKIFPNRYNHHKYINATISAILFGLFHFPNMPLMIGTILGGFLWAMWWGERRNLYMMSLMHGFNGSIIETLIPMSMSVGPPGL